MAEPSAPAPIRSARAWALGALLVLVSLGVYWPCLRGGMLWDDDAHVTRESLRSLEGLGRIWTSLHATQQYYPLLHSAFWLEHRLWGDSTLGYHLLNVLLHAGAAFLLYRLLLRLRVPGAAWACLLFAVHPVCVESVAWISEQKNTLSLVFYLLSAHAYLRFDAGRSRRAYLLALLLYCFALLTKSVTATLPAALLVVLWMERGRLSPRRDVLPLAPWFALGIAGGLLTSWVERSLIGAAGPEFDLSPLERLLLAGRVIGFYLEKLLLPRGLMFIYPHWDVPSQAPGWIPWLLGALALTALLWTQRKRSRGPLAAWLLFTGSLLPALGFFNVYPFIFSYVADHFQYLPSLAIFAALGAALHRALARLPGWARGAGLAAAVLLLCLLALQSVGQSRIYQDEPTLYSRTLDLNPACWMAHNNLGLWDERHGDTERALREYEAALALKREIPTAQANLGSVLGRKPGGAQEAVQHFEAAIRMDPGSAQAHNNLGAALLTLPGRLPEAVAQFQAAVRLRPGLAQVHLNLANAWMNAPGHSSDAESEFREALRLNPRSGEAHNNLGLLLNRTGRPAEAVEEFRSALQLMPEASTIHFNLALALLHLSGKQAQAEAELETLLAQDPGNEPARTLLGRIRASEP